MFAALLTFLRLSKKSDEPSLVVMILSKKIGVDLSKDLSKHTKSIFVHAVLSQRTYEFTENKIDDIDQAALKSTCLD